MNQSDLEAKLLEVIGQGIEQFPRASPVDLVRWTRENHGDLVEQIQTKWTDDKLVSLYLTAMRRRADAKTETDTMAESQSFEFAQESPEQEQSYKKPGPSSARESGKKPLVKGVPRFGHPNQSRLPFSEEFEKIPYYLILEARTRTSRGREVELPNATLKDLKARRAFIRGAQSVELPQLNRLIQVMEPYDKAQPGIRVKTALQLRATARRREDRA